MGGGEDPLVGLEMDERLAISLGEVDPQKDHRVVEKEIGRNGRHVGGGVVAEENGVMPAINRRGYGCTGGGISPKHGAVVVDELEAKVPGVVEVFTIQRDFARIRHRSRLQIGKRKAKSGSRSHNQGNGQGGAIKSIHSDIDYFRLKLGRVHTIINGKTRLALQPRGSSEN